MKQQPRSKKGSSTESSPKNLSDVDDVDWRVVPSLKFLTINTKHHTVRYFVDFLLNVNQNTNAS